MNYKEFDRLVAEKCSEFKWNFRAECMPGEIAYYKATVDRTGYNNTIAILYYPSSPEHERWHVNVMWNITYGATLDEALAKQQQQ